MEDELDNNIDEQDIQLVVENEKNYEEKKKKKKIKDKSKISKKKNIVMYWILLLVKCIFMNTEIGLHMDLKQNEKIVDGIIVSDKFISGVGFIISLVNSSISGSVGFFILLFTYRVFLFFLFGLQKEMHVLMLKLVVNIKNNKTPKEEWLQKIIFKFSKICTNMPYIGNVNYISRNVLINILYLTDDFSTGNGFSYSSLPQTQLVADGFNKRDPYDQIILLQTERINLMLNPKLQEKINKTIQEIRKRFKNKFHPLVKKELQFFESGLSKNE